MATSEQKASLLCKKCKTKPEVTSYCSVCTYICTICTRVHEEWNEFAEHKVVSLNVSEQFEIAESLAHIENKLSGIDDRLKQLHEKENKLNNIKGEIEVNAKALKKAIEERQAEHIEVVNERLYALTAEKKELEKGKTELSICKRGLESNDVPQISEAEQTAKELMQNMPLDFTSKTGDETLRFKTASGLGQACRHFGMLYESEVCPQKCYATGRGLEVAKIGENATAILHVLDQQGEAYAAQESEMTTVCTCELVSDGMQSTTNCSVNKTESNQWKISYQPTSSGIHQLHVKVNEEHINVSPFTVIVPKKFRSAVRVVSGLKGPQGIAFNARGEMVVAEYNGNRVSIVTTNGVIERNFGGKKEGNGQLNCPCGVAVNDEGDILVADAKNNRIQVFQSDGTFKTVVGRYGRKSLEFDFPVGIGINHHNKKIYVTENGNHRIQILNPDLSHANSFGQPHFGRPHFGQGREPGKLHQPKDVAFDSTGNVYVADNEHNCIQVFTAEGEFLRMFGNKGTEDGKLLYPTGICIDSNNVVYITELGNNRISAFTINGKFLTSFGKKGNEEGQFVDPRGIAMDRDGLVYVSDQKNDRVQVF